MDDKETFISMLARNGIYFRSTNSNRVEVGCATFVFNGANRLERVDSSPDDESEDY